MTQSHNVSAAARIISESVGEEVSPKQLTDLFYRRLLDVNRCPIVGDRRMIPADYLPQIIEVLRSRGVVCASKGVYA
jgi:hypothetical protein